MEFFPEYAKLEAAIKAAGKRAQDIRANGLAIMEKGRQDFVSDADIAVENDLKEAILPLFPNDQFLGEESGLSDKEGVKAQSHKMGVWVIDPIDGTTNFLQRMDYWCVSVAYVVNNEIELGFIYAPDRDEFFFAMRDKGAYLNGKKLSMTEPEIGQAIIGLGRSNRRPLKGYLDLLQTLDALDIEYRRFGAGALMLAHVSSGLVHGYFEAHLNSWDALAGLLLIQEAGGKVSSFLDSNGLFEGNLVWAASPLLWDRLETNCLTNDSFLPKSNDLR
ncbi:inositol monophosphatase family protein [Marinomonas balearica]|uniref:Myo-inositol-1(Or 4)-monophosphatase n=1 Tax=Marinomonas balearica TaxID=491947 RepID=A0A4R6MBT4_9GAMM|nr:inositol monophosphatase [Marinomonas balearica]TDO98973.1 myo-inositol-1(or 4)-monophosphatase [Marinomonas balearica]